MDFLEVLLVVFIVLKLCKIITWAWVWVLSPLWMGFLFVGFIWVIAKIYKLIVDTFM